MISSWRESLRSDSSPMRRESMVISAIMRLFVANRAFTESSSARRESFCALRYWTLESRLLRTATCTSVPTAFISCVRSMVTCEQPVSANDKTTRLRANRFIFTI